MPTSGYSRNTQNHTSTNKAFIQRDWNLRVYGPTICSEIIEYSRCLKANKPPIKASLKIGGLKFKSLDHGNVCTFYHYHKDTDRCDQLWAYHE